MTDFPAVDYVENAARTAGEMKTALDALAAGAREFPGGSAETTLTIASGNVTPGVGAAGIFSIDTQAAAAADDLSNIIQTNVRDGAQIIIRCANAARVVTVKHNAGGAGTIVLAGSADLVLDATTKWLWLKRTGTSWEEIGRFPAVAAGDATTFTGGGAAVDETARLSAAITAAAGKTLRVVGDMLLNGLAIGVDHDLDLSGARIYYPPTNSAIVVAGTWGALTTVVATTAVTSGTDLLTNVEVASTSGWAVGDWFKIWSADLYPFQDDNARPYKAEFARVRAILSSPPRLQVGSLRDTYTTTPKLRKLSTMRSGIRGGRFVANGDINDLVTYPGPRTLAAIIGRGLLQPRWHDLFVESAWSYGVRLESVVGVDLRVGGRNLINQNPTDINGYLVLATYCSQSGRIQILPTSRCRHAFTNGALSGLAAFTDDDWEKHGAVRDLVIDGTGFSAEGASFDTHAFAFNLTFIGCVAASPRPYGSGSTSCFSNRAHGTTYIACRASDASVGFRDYAGQFAWGIPGETRWINCVAENVTNGFNALGLAGITIYKTVAIGCSVDGCSAVGYVFDADARVVLNACMASRFATAPIRWEGNNATLDIVNGFTADYRQAGSSYDGLAGNGISIGTSSIVVTGAVCNIDNLTFIGSATRPPGIFSVLNASSVVTISRFNFHPRNKTNPTLVNAGGGTVTIGGTVSKQFDADGVAAATTDASGDLTVTHGLAATPTVLNVTMDGTTFRHGQPHTIGATTFKIRVTDAAGAAVASTAVTAYWRARV